VGVRCYHRAEVLPSGEVLIVGGCDDAMLSAGYRSVQRYDPRTDMWTPAPGLRSGRYGFGSTTLPDGRVLVAGGATRAAWGGRHEGENQITTTAELFEP